ncbi:conserved hypothetical protein [uncultured Mycobacterium sp.]|uniref:Uncharacterized protein n=1 Tax=uncultured Mycobacterium sp. TaxID=171292 RepID=A0A1Y5PGR1_9MYCO|nr:conserved hypothetical protein [uncultured Mycobacterium sp.]
MVAYGLVIVTVVVGVEVSVSGGTVSSPAVSLGDGGADVGFSSVVEIRVDLVVVVFVDVREVVVDVVLIAGAYVTGPSCRELSAVSMTAYTSSTTSSSAATPET